MSTRQLVRIGIVGDDVAAARNLNCFDSVRGDTDGAGQLDRAVLVGVFKANVQNRRLLAAIQTFLQLFFGDPFDRHGRYCFLRLKSSSRSGLKPRSAFRRTMQFALRGPFLADDLAGCERQCARDFRFAPAFQSAWWGHQRRLLTVNRPSVRPLAAIDTTKEDGTWLAAHTVVMTSRQVTTQQIPHDVPLKS